MADVNAVGRTGTRMQLHTSGPTQQKQRSRNDEQIFPSSLLKLHQENGIPYKKRNQVIVSNF